MEQPKTLKIYGTKRTYYITNDGSDGEWSRDSTETIWSVHGCGLKTPVDKTTLSEIDTHYSSGTLFLLYAISSTGDSFGHDAGYFFEPIWVFNDRTLAEDALRKIKAHLEFVKKNKHNWDAPEKDESNPYGFTSQYSLEIDVGEYGTLPVHATWVGYFESLDELEIFEFSL